MKFLRMSSLASISRRLKPTTSCHMQSWAMPDPVCCVRVCDRISLSVQRNEASRGFDLLAGQWRCRWYGWDGVVGHIAVTWVPPYVVAA